MDALHGWCMKNLCTGLGSSCTAQSWFYYMMHGPPLSVITWLWNFRILLEFLRMNFYITMQLAWGRASEAYTSLPTSSAQIYLGWQNKGFPPKWFILLTILAVFVLHLFPSVLVTRSPFTCSHLQMYVRLSWLCIFKWICMTESKIWKRIVNICCNPL